MVVPAGSMTEQCAEPLAPVTVVRTDTEVMPGAPLKAIWEEKEPLVAVAVETVVVVPAPEGVAVIRVVRPPIGGVTKPLTWMITVVAFTSPATTAIEHGSARATPLPGAAAK